MRWPTPTSTAKTGWSRQTFAEHLRDVLGWESVYAYNQETFGPNGTLGRANEREVVLVRDLRAALERLNPDLPEAAREQAVEKLTRIDYARSLVQHNREFYGFIRDGVPVEWRDASGETKYARAQVIDFRNGTTDGKPNNRFLAVRELKIQGVRVPHYNRRADLVCFVNGLPLVFIELKAVYRNIRAGFDDNLTDYLGEHSIAHAFHHNAFLVVSNGHRARYGSITSKWEHFVEWKRNDEKDKGRVDAEVLLDGMLAKERLLDLVENFILFDDSRAGGTRKIVARNHQVLGVNNAVASVLRQEELKRQFPPEERLIEYSGARGRTAAAESSDGSRTAGRTDWQPRTICQTTDARRSSCRLIEARPSRPGPAGGVLAHPGQRQVLLDGVLRREGAPRRAGQLHLPGDDRPRGPGRPDLAHVHRVRRGGREDAAGRLGRGVARDCSGRITASSSA